MTPHEYESIRRMVEAETLRKLAYFLEAQENIGAILIDRIQGAEDEWWEKNIREDRSESGYSGMLYTDDPEDAWEWFHRRADLVETGEWRLPDRFYNEPERVTLEI